ncbi:hypothetical protein HPB51_026134 [Rhipicephalus microplus]|uniref:Uncharacterized protein n=1 Tax=Rhipicephalus microplus TaxID=6941 RepID=A0A9J6EVQ7_RHIMP|nr:hypothetical protein HPB51_026134 [Rhipicephalus microplus]
MATCRAKKYAPPNARLKRDFLDWSFGHSSKMCDRLSFDKNLTWISNNQNKLNPSEALSILCDTFGSDADKFADYVTCATCKQSLIAGRFPSLSTGSRLERFNDDNDATYDEDEIEALPEIRDSSEPAQAAIALNAVSRTLVYDDKGACTGGSAKGAEAGEEVSDEDARRVIDITYSLHVAPGENKFAISLFFDEYAEEYAFPTIYLSVPRTITGHRSTQFAIAISEIKRTDQRGMTPEHVLYMAAKVMRFNVAEKTMTFPTNVTTDSFTSQQLERRKFLDDALNRDHLHARNSQHDPVLPEAVQRALCYDSPAGQA